LAIAGRPDARTTGLPPFLMSLIRVIDRISDWSGRIVCWMIVPLVGSLAWEVVARYVFAAPTVWAYDLSYMLYGAFFMLGAGYALFRGGHIRTDMLYQNWSPRRQGAIDAVCYLFLFFPAMLFLLWMGGQEAWHAWEIGERSDASPSAMLLLQGISEFLKSLYAVRTGRLYAKREVIEV
jgi:TRAP-type mannitol/chloroaromatic compound transport system permease small subunit